MPGEVVRPTDRTRATYIRRYFGCDWKDPPLSHMMISSQLGQRAQNPARGSGAPRKLIAQGMASGGEPSHYPKHKRAEMP